MKTSGALLGVLLALGLGMSALKPAPQAPPGGFTLSAAVPNDVFLYVAGRRNPERKFLEDYWQEVSEALADTGVAQDVLDLLGGLVGADAQSEIQRLTSRASELISALDWRLLAGREFAFAERFGALETKIGSGNAFVMPEMVWIFRGSAAGAAHHFQAFDAILVALAEEINRAAGSEGLTVTRSEQHGARVASVNLLAMLPGAPALPLSIACRDDVVIVGLRGQLLEDVLALLANAPGRASMGAEPRFRNAFENLPPAEDSLTFFDLPALVNPLRNTIFSAIEMAETPGDVYRNTEMTPEQTKLNAEALAVYQRGEYAKALALVEELHRAAPDNALVLYNLACFNALNDHPDAALRYLEQAVERGFHAPAKISTDTDLSSLRADPRYQAALAKAAELAHVQRAEDVVLNSAKSGEAYTLTMQAWQAGEQQDYERGLKLVEQAQAVAPTDSRVLYALACFHARLGHQDKALSFLQQAVAGGFYCPAHIAADADLESLRGAEGYEQALSTARAQAAQHSADQSGAQVAWVKVVIDRIVAAVGIIDHVAAVEYTDGYAGHMESIAALVPDAAARPIYPVFAGKPPATEFDRFLPQETLSFAVSTGIDLNALYRFLEDSVRQLGEPGTELLAQWEALQQQLGVHVQRDLIGWIEGGMISVTLEQERGSVWLLRVTDPQVAHEKVSAAIDFFVSKLPEVISQNPSLAPFALMSTVSTAPLNRDDLPGFESIQFAMLPQPAVWGVTDDYLVFSSSAEAAALCLATARGTHPSIRKNERVMAEALLPNGPFHSLTLTDERQFGEQLAEGLGIAAMVTGMLGSFIPEPQVNRALTKVAGIITKLTPVARKIDFFKSTASVTTLDDKGWRTRQVTHYFSPAERSARRQATTTAAARY